MFRASGFQFRQSKGEHLSTAEVHAGNKLVSEVGSGFKVSLKRAGSERIRFCLRTEMAEGGAYYLRSFTNDGDLEKENNKQEILSHEDEEEVKNTEHPKITEVKKQREKIAQGDAVDEVVVMTGSDATSTCRRKVGSRNDGLDDEAIKSPQRNTSQQNLTVQKELYQGRSSVSDSRLTTVPKVTAVPDQIEDNYPISRKGKNLTQSQIYLNPRQEPGRPIPAGVIGNGTNHFYGIPDPDRHNEYIPRHPQRQFIQSSSNNHCEFIRLVEIITYSIVKKIMHLNHAFPLSTEKGTGNLFGSNFSSFHRDVTGMKTGN